MKLKNFVFYQIEKKESRVQRAQHRSTGIQNFSYYSHFADNKYCFSKGAEVSSSTNEKNTVTDIK